MSESKFYAGDSVYADTDGFGIILTTENGLPSDPSNSIYLEPSVLISIVKFAFRTNMIVKEDV